jgi:hypothetical protein
LLPCPNGRIRVLERAEEAGDDEGDDELERVRTA